MMKIAVLVSGGGTNLQAILDRIADGRLSGVSVACVVASREDAFALERARPAGIPASVVSRKAYASFEAYDAAMLDVIAKSGAELVVAAGFLSLIGPKVLGAYANRVINVHPSLIPSFCGQGMYGIRPHEAALAKGVKVSGATVHILNGEYDEGPILLQKAVDVLAGDTPESLQQRIMVECEQEILPRAIQMFADGKF